MKISQTSPMRQHFSSVAIRRGWASQSAKDPAERSTSYASDVSKIRLLGRIFAAVILLVCVPVNSLAQDHAALNGLFAQAVQMESKDQTEATRLYERAAQQGHTPSMVMLGYRLIYGTGAPEDRPRAFSLISKAAQAGNLDGKFLLALCYLQGVGTSRNAATARENLLDPATQGNQWAQYTLAIMLEAGEGGPKREAAARRWLDRAAGGPDRELAARASDFRNKLDAKLFSPDDSTGQALTALFFVALIGAAMGGGGSDGGTSNGPGSSGGMASSPNVSPAVPRPVPHYPNNPTKVVNGDLTDPTLVWR
jgi:TPR repeat protein